MQRKSCTVVTMFFNLKNLRDASKQTRTLDFYIKNGKNTLSLQYPMIIYCDEDSKGFLEEIRNEAVGDSFPTKYIVKHLVDYELYKQNWDVIHENRQKSKGYKNKDDRNTVSYYLMGMFKPYCMRMSKELNPFNTTHYAWVDLGCSHVVRDFNIYAPLMLSNPKPKVTVCYIHYRSNNEIYPYTNYIEYGGPCGVASTAYTIEASYVDKFYSLCMNVFYDMLFHGYGHTDETVMTYAYDKDPSIFNIYNGDYYSIFSNYHTPVGDHNTIFSCFISEAIKKNNQEVAKKSAFELYFYIIENDIQSPYKESLQKILNL
jgi:hypothetical protein